MNIDAFLFLQRSDLVHYRDAGMNLGDIPHIFIDPGMVDEAVKLGLNPAHFSYRPLPVDPHFQTRVMTEATARATLLDQALTKEREELFGPGVFQGWDHGPFRQFFTRALVAKYQGAICDRHLAEARIGLMRPSKPQLGYFDSFLATDLFMGDAERWRVVEHYDKVLDWAPDHASFVFDFGLIAQMASDGMAQAVTHIPTSYQNGRRYIADIERGFAHNIDLPSALWDVPVRRQAPMLKRIDSLRRDQIRDRAFMYRERASRILAAHLGDLLITHVGLQKQVDMLAERCFMQAINYDGLMDALRGTQPHFILTDHDTGHNGPLYAVAAKLDAPITVLPHSSHPVFAVPHAVKVRAIEQDGFQTPVRSVWGERVQMQPVRFGHKVAPAARSQITTVCLLFNTVLSQGISYIDFAGMTRFYHALSALCHAHGVRLIPRLKPSGAPPLMSAAALELPADVLQDLLSVPLSEIAQASDLCISYGEPTSAGIDFLSLGSYLIHTTNQYWPSEFWATPAYIGDGTVPSYTDEQALAVVKALLTDSAHFAQCADMQRQRFTSHLTATDSPIFAPR